MAITGKFAADFESFYSAVQKAEVSLKSFETGASKVEKSLTTMANSFSGQKVISDATLMTKAIEAGGGAATLTAKEMARVNATVTEAIAKYTALGQVAPKSMTDLATATTKTDDASSGFMGSLSKMGGLLSALGVGLSVGAVVNFGKALVSDADALVKLHDKTAISLQDLQRLQIVGDDAGVSLDAMAMAVNRLQKNIGSDNEGASQALRTLGLKMEDIRAMSPENQFYEISKALAAIKDPAQQVALGTALMGKGFVEVLPAIKAGFEDVRKASVGMSDDTIRNLDAVGDAFGKMWRTTKGVVANMLVDVFHPTVKGFSEAAASMLALKEATEKLVPPISKVMPHEVIVDVKEFDRAMESSSKTISEATAKTKAQNTALDAVNQKIRDATRDVGHLTTAQEASVKQYKALGLSTEEVALKMGVSAGAVTRYEAETKKAEDAAKKFNDELVKNTAAAEKNESGLAGLHVTVGVLTTTELDVVKATLAAYAAFEKLTDKIDDIEESARIANFGFRGMADGLEKLGTQSTELDDIAKHLDEAKKHTVDWSSALDSLAATLVQMAQFDAFGEAGEQIAVAVVQANALAKAVEKVSSASATTGQKLQGAADIAGITFTIITTLIQKSRDAAAAAGKIAREAANAQVWNTAIGFSEQLNASINKLGSELPIIDIIKELGGVANLTDKQLEHMANTTVPTLMEMIQRGGKDSVLAMEALKQLFEDMVPGLDDVKAAADVFGLTLDQLGPKVRQMEIDEQANKAAAAFELLAASGVDTSVIIGKMSDEVRQSFVKMAQDAVKFGLTIPESMKPLLQGLLDNGDLIDETGEKFKDLSQIKFTKPLEKMVDDLMAKLDQLISKFLDVGNTKVPPIKIPVFIQPSGPAVEGDTPFESSPASMGGLVTPSGIQHFAGGGSVLRFQPRGSDTVPAMLTPGEMVLTPAQQARLLRGGGTDNAAVVAEVKQLRAELKDQRRDLPRALGLAMSSAFVLNRKAS